MVRLAGLSPIYMKRMQETCIFFLFLSQLVLWHWEMLLPWRETGVNIVNEGSVRDLWRNLKNQLIFKLQAENLGASKAGHSSSGTSPGKIMDSIVSTLWCLLENFFKYTSSELIMSLLPERLQALNWTYLLDWGYRRWNKSIPFYLKIQL